MANGSSGHTQEHQDGASSAMVVSKDPAFKLAMEPSSLEALYKMAAAIAKIGLCGVKAPEEALARMLCGRELGLTMMQALRGVYVIEGQPSLSAALKEALCLSHPEVCEEFTLLETSDKKAAYRVKRRGRAAREYAFTIEDAQRAGLVKEKSGWAKWPARMLMARAKSSAADAEFGDLLLGFATREEMEDERIAVREVRGAAAPPAPASGRTVDAEFTTVQPTVSTAPRDVDAECGRLKEEIMNATTKELRSAVRAKVAAFSADVGAPWSDEIQRFYNMTHTSAKEPAQANLPANAAG